MMPSLEKIYDPAFFKEWGRNNPVYADSAFRIAGVLYDYFKPKSLIDWGCGCGVYGFYFKERGAKVLGIDAVTVPPSERFPIEIAEHDLTEPMFKDLGWFDLSICLEVGEHIPANLRDVFLGNITKFSDTLLLSCAPPHQGGHYHVNEQPKRYWIAALRRHGFLYNRRKTGHLVEIFKSMQPGIKLAWMFRHISVYERPSEPN